MNIPAEARPAPREKPAAEAHADLLICCGGLSDQTSLEDVLRQAGPGHRAVTLSQAAAAMRAQPESRLLLIFTPAEPRIAAAMMQKVAPMAALKSWEATALALLDVLRRNRRRTTLVDSRAVQAHAGALAAGLNLEPQTVAALAALPRPRPDPVLLALAEVCVLRTPRIHTLNEELVACTLGLSDALPPEQDLDAAFHHYLKTCSALTKIRSDLEARYLEGQGHAGVQTAGATPQQLHLSATGGLAAERDSLQTALSNQRKTAEQEQARLRNRAAELESKLAGVEAWIHGIQASRSYRIMEPLRRLRAATKRKE
ncbi:hypothetical protein [Puniceibacterium sediminis]|nr:hypothetical protein [Puniceibacterium sediminis]